LMRSKYAARSTVMKVILARASRNRVCRWYYIGAQPIPDRSLDAT
jgi:hypothetical protein